MRFARQRRRGFMALACSVFLGALCFCWTTSAIQSRVHQGLTVNRVRALREWISTARSAFEEVHHQLVSNQPPAGKGKEHDTCDFLRNSDEVLAYTPDGTVAGLDEHASTRLESVRVRVVRRVPQPARTARPPEDAPQEAEGGEELDAYRGDTAPPFGLSFYQETWGVLELAAHAVVATGEVTTHPERVQRHLFVVLEYQREGETKRRLYAYIFPRPIGRCSS